MKARVPFKQTSITSLPLGISLRRVSKLPKGIFMAFGTCPVAYSLGSRTSIICQFSLALMPASSWLADIIDSGDKALGVELEDPVAVCSWLEVGRDGAGDDDLDVAFAPHPTKDITNIKPTRIDITFILKHRNDKLHFLPVEKHEVTLPTPDKNLSRLYAPC